MLIFLYKEKRKHRIPHVNRGDSVRTSRLSLHPDRSTAATFREITTALVGPVLQVWLHYNGTSSWIGEPTTFVRVGNRINEICVDLDGFLFVPTCWLGVNSGG